MPTGLKQLQRQMEVAAEAAGLQLPPPPPRVSDAVRSALGITREDEARMQQEVSAARAEGFVGDDTTGSRVGAGSAGSVIDAATEVPSQDQQGASGGSDDGANSGSGSGVPKRSWGSWARNERISRSGSSLLQQARSSVPQTGGSDATGGALSSPTSGAITSSNSSSSTTTTTNTTTSTNSTGSGIAGAGPPGPSTEAGSLPPVTDDGSTIVSKQVGKQRALRSPADPRARQDAVREALRAAAEDWTTAPASASSGTGSKPADANTVPPELLGGAPEGAPRQWWQRRFEVLFMPTLSYADGSSGFVQVDVSLRPGAKDVRVLTFEDRHDCMHCLAVMAQWPGMSDAQLSMGAMPTAGLEREVRGVWLEQRRQAQARLWAGGAMPGPEAPGPSPPSGVVVFRRGKLPLRSGMGQEEFMELVVYHAAAQGALGRVGYGFDD
jgi:hypothetical protein